MGIRHKAVRNKSMSTIGLKNTKESCRGITYIFSTTDAYIYIFILHICSIFELLILKESLTNNFTKAAHVSILLEFFFSLN